MCLSWCLEGSFKYLENMGNRILIYNQHTFKVFKYEIVQFRVHLYQFQRAEKFKKLHFSHVEEERDLGAKGSTDSEAFMLSSSSRQLCAASIKFLGLTKLQVSHLSPHPPQM